MVNKNKDLIINKSFKSPAVEAYKTLRTNIQFSLPNGGPKTMLVTSSSPGEGKSTTAANLAITMVQAQKRVLLIDGDLRKPVINRLFEISNLKGLTNILAENIDYSDAVKPNVIGGLDIITSGPKPPNPSELLGSDRMRAIIEMAKRDYDLIIIDTPPVLAVTDAIILSSMVDGVVMVTAHGHATFDGVERSKALLERANARMLGVILNNIPLSQAGGYYYYYEEDMAPGTKVNYTKNAEAKA